MNNLKETTLPDICLKVTDGTHDSPKLQPSGIPFIKGKHITGGYIDFNNCDFITYEDHLEVIKRSKAELGDILFSNIGTVGSTAIVNTNIEFSIKNIALFKPDKEKVDNRYLFYLVRSPFFQNSLLAKKSGVAQPFISLEMLRKHKFNFHSNKEFQKKISSILSTYDDLIENNTRRINILEEMAQRIYKEWFVDFKYPGHENDKLVDSELGMIPEGWEVNNIGDFIQYHIGGGWGKEELSEEFDTSGYVIRGTDIPLAKYGSIIKCPYRYHKSSNMKSRELKTGDIVFEVSGGSKDQPLGRSLLVNSELLSSFDDKVMCASFCKIIRPKAFSDFIYLHLLDIYDNRQIMKYQVQSTGISNFKFQVFLDNHKIICPNKIVLDDFTSRVSSLFSQIQILGKKNMILSQTRALLLPKLISGKIDVSELDIDTSILND